MHVRISILSLLMFKTRSCTVLLLSPNLSAAHGCGVGDLTLCTRWSHSWFPFNHVPILFGMLLWFVCVSSTVPVAMNPLHVRRRINAYVRTYAVIAPRSGCLGIFICACIAPLFNTQVYTYKHVRTYVYVSTYTYSMYIRMYIRTYIRIYIRTYVDLFSVIYLRNVCRYRSWVSEQCQPCYTSCKKVLYVVIAFWSKVSMQCIAAGYVRTYVRSAVQRRAKQSNINIYIYTYVYIFIYIRIRTHIRVYVRTYICIYVCVHTNQKVFVLIITCFGQPMRI